MKKGKKLLLPFSLVLLLVIAGVFYMESIVSQAETIPSESIKQQLETMYNGEVGELLLSDEIYTATLIREDSVYGVRVDSETGQVLSMVLEESSNKGEQELAERTESGEDESSNAKKEEQPTQPVQEEPKLQPETPVQPEPEPQPQQKPQAQPPVSKPAPQKTVLLTEQQAVLIALDQLYGEVDDVDFVKTSEGGYYLVEIEIDVDDGPDEATFQIHAISGKIMSVTWDD